MRLSLIVNGRLIVDDIELPADVTMAGGVEATVLVADGPQGYLGVCRVEQTFDARPSPRLSPPGSAS